MCIYIYIYICLGCSDRRIADSRRPGLRGLDRAPTRVVLHYSIVYIIMLYCIIHIVPYSIVCDIILYDTISYHIIS